LPQLEIERDSSWAIIKAACQGTAGRAGAYGLWKPGGHGDDRLLFEVPSSVCDAIEELSPSDPGGLVPGCVLAWARASLNNHVPDGWTPPPHDLVESWIPAGGLTLQVGAVLLQGELILNESRWALRWPIVPDIPPDLPPARACCLRDLAADGQHQCRMVRVFLAANEVGSALEAEIDLTGAPQAEPLFQACLDGLRHVALWLAETAELLADVDVTIRSPELLHPETTTTKERSNPT